jgi:hypothetical protein
MLKQRSSSNVMPTNLGELELRVMQILWQRPHMDARQIREALPGMRTPTLSTVQSTLERLYRKASSWVTPIPTMPLFRDRTSWVECWAMSSSFFMMGACTPSSIVLCRLRLI